MKLVFRLAATLGLITGVAGFGLGLVYTATKDRIAAAAADETVKGLALVLPGYELDAETTQRVDDVEYWVGRNREGSLGYAFIAIGSGYSGEIRTLVGMNAQGEILGITVLSQQETPGLGARVQEVASKVYLWQWLTGQAPKEMEPGRPWFAQQFRGLKAEEIEIHKGVEWQAMSDQERQALREQNAVSALSGATITTRAITRSIEAAAAKVLSAAGKGGPPPETPEAALSKP